MDSRRVIRVALSLVAVFVLTAASLETTPPDGGRDYVPAPDEGCIEASQVPGATPKAGQTESCDGAGTGSGGGGVGVLGNVLPLVAVIVAGVLAIGISGAVLVIRSRPPVVAGPMEGWWTCVACGASNLTGAPRCHRCGAWQPTTQSRPGGHISP